MGQTNQSTQSLALTLPKSLLSVAPKFSLGMTVKTHGANQLLSSAEVNYYLHRYVRGDWGNTAEGDHEMNDLAIEDGDRILATYDTPYGQQIWIITEWDRSVTTVLLPDEY